MTLRKTLTLVAAILVCGGAATLRAAEPVSPTEFESVHKLIKPQPGESRWMEIPWLTSVWAARQQAAAEGKPIFIWAGSGGGPVGVC